MKLSEAILLGRSLVVANGGFLLRPHHDGTMLGCALGMACAAISYVPQKQDSLAEILELWPWTTHTLNASECSCTPYFQSVAHFIAHMFDVHVMGRQEPRWTLEQLVDKIASIEPATETAEGLGLGKSAQTTASENVDEKAFA